jgi:hypothetical protein
MEKRYPAYRVKFPAVTYCSTGVTRKAGKVLKNFKIHFKNRKVADTTESMLCSYGKNIIPVTEISPVNK